MAFWPFKNRFVDFCVLFTLQEVFFTWLISFPLSPSEYAYEIGNKDIKWMEGVERNVERI